ncbi:Molybdenum ABC transporter ATP-binding protein ModC [hydrothermal vent metagenome]|uniref:Molybdenum ABC transporter ATP-binding protein ModC n=1 Tax=hydrothermal vent metagenome TaxID=652676 RepID=A0A3B1B5N6_9ZZZZ
MSGINFSFALKRGDFRLDAEAVLPGLGVTALFGASGSGKTSLLRCIAGLEQACWGRLEVNGECWQDSDKGLFVPPHQRAIGYVFQEAVLFPHLQVRGNLEYGWRRTPSRERKGQLDHVCDILGIADLLERYPHQLSGGEKQRVALGRALLNSPRLLLMDEPMAALDRPRKAEIMPYLERLHAEADIPVLYVTHDMEELARIADHLALVENGRVLKQGPLVEMLVSLDLPIALDEDAGAVIATQVTGHDDEYHLTSLHFCGGNILVGRINRAVGESLNIRIHARDVSLVLQPPGESSILNVVEVVVTEIVEQGPGRIMVRLDASGVPLLARITLKSQAKLGLKVGMQIYAQIKSVALNI